MIRDAKVLEACLSDLLESMPDASFLVNSTGSLVLVNGLTEKLFGYQSAELRGKSIDALIPERFRRVHAAHCSDYFIQPRTRAMGVGLSLLGLRKDGAEFPVEISLSPIETDAGTFVLGTIRDITQSEERYRAIFEQVAVGVVHSNSEGRVLNANPKFCEMLGYTQQEVFALDIRDLTHAEDIETTISARARLLPGGEGSADEREARLIRKDGTEIWAHIATSLVRSADGRPVHFISVIYDVSAQKRTEEQRHETELRFRQVTDNIHEVFWLTDPAKNEVLYVSPAYEAIWARSAQALYSSPRSWLEAIHADDRARVSEAAKTRQATGDYDEEYRIVRPDGSVRWIWDRAVPVRDEGGMVIRVAGVAEDITERKHAADRLRESERRFSEMLQNVELVATMLDKDGGITYCNNYLLRLSGWRYEEVFGRKWFDLFLPPETHEEMKGVFAALLADFPEAVHHENEILTRSRERRLIRWNNTLLRSLAGEVVGTASIGEDITELRRAEGEIERTVAKLRRAARSAIEVVSTIGELRDPYTHGHERRVGEVATAIATEMGLPADRIEGVRVCAYLHDVGKIAVPAEILSKPTRLSATEFELVKQHAQQSYEILKRMEFPWPVAEAVWQHHERLDGSGYPRKLKGEEIILEARILAVADTVEAMASHRPYRPGLGVEAALAEIEANRGKLFDPTVVDACLRLFRTKGYRLPP
jgi:PAS domain S-box-containing protein/putative nucleotidyltransferase with HDIG domain